MSAGGLSYSGLVNHGKVTLPSVDTWGSNMNIIRDPPRSITTRKIDKVGETSSITEMIDDSGNRACEAIQVYARGVNPFVSVEYSNYGNNGGQGVCVTEGGQQAAKLPYSIMRDGAFRPPVLLQEDLLPLSRMPRNWTSAFSKPGFADFSRKMRTCGTASETKEVKTTSLQGCVRPTAVYKMETPLSEPFEVKYVIQPTIKNSATSGVRTMDITQQHVGNPTKEIDDTPIHAMAHANYTDTRNYVNNNEFDSKRYIQDSNTHQVSSNLSSNKHHTSIEDILDLSDMPVHQNIRNVSAVSQLSGPEQTKYFHENIELSRTLPEYYARTNTGNQNIHKRMDYENDIHLKRNTPMNSFISNPVARGHSDHGSRDVRLAPKIQPGGYSVPGQIPNQNRMQNVEYSNESEKARMNRMVMENMQGRFDYGAPTTMVR